MTKGFAFLVCILLLFEFSYLKNILKASVVDGAISSFACAGLGKYMYFNDFEQYSKMKCVT